MITPEVTDITTWNQVVEILFKSDRLRKQCNDPKQRLRAFGPVRSGKLKLRLDDLDATPTLELARNIPGRLHELKGDRAGQLAISLDEPFRLILEPAHDPIPAKPDGGLDWSAVTAVRILEIVDYHD